MLGKIPVAGYPTSFLDIFESILHREYSQDDFNKALKVFLSSRYLFLCSSGLGSLYLILKAIKNTSNKKEIVLPAYTTPSLILPIRKLKLKPVLCDISLDDFNLDTEALANSLSCTPLCVIYVYLFGIVSAGVEYLKRSFSDIFVIEDCAQAFGSRLQGRTVGNFGDASIFSFARGKNLSTYVGGCITTNNDKLAKDIGIEIKNLKEDNLLFKLLIRFELLILSFAIRPYFYGLFYPLIYIFKDKVPHKDFKLRKYTDVQASVGLSFLKRIEEFNKIRYDNGMKLIEGLRDIEYIILPKISSEAEPAFNRFPIVFKDARMRERVRQKLNKIGIEATGMYIRPIHHIYDLGYKKDEFPHAVYLAQRLLTLPVHPLVNQDTIDRMIDILRSL